jgi:hypothetical protein
MSQLAHSAAQRACDSLTPGEFVLRLTSKDPRQRTDESVAQARAARDRGARFFQLYLPLEDPPERWPGEQMPLVRAGENARSWTRRRRRLLRHRLAALLLWLLPALLVLASAYAVSRR